MATITDRLGPFTGHVGPVRFHKGVAQTEDPDMLGYFRDDPDRYDVTDAGSPADIPHADLASLADAALQDPDDHQE